MIFLKVNQSNIPKRKKEVVTFEVTEDFLRRQLEKQGYALIKKSNIDNPIPTRPCNAIMDEE